MNNMLEIGGVEYVIDLDALEALLTTKNDKGDYIIETDNKYSFDGNGKKIGQELFERKYERNREIDMAKYETIRTLIEIVLTTNEEVDDNLGIERGLSELPLPFKLSFNTLINYGVIKEL